MKSKTKLPKPRDEVMVYHLSNRFNCGAHATKKSYNRKDKSWKKDCLSGFFSPSAAFSHNHTTWGVKNLRLFFQNFVQKKLIVENLLWTVGRDIIFL